MLVLAVIAFLTVARMKVSFGFVLEVVLITGMFSLLLSSAHMVSRTSLLPTPSARELGVHKGDGMGHSQDS